MCWELPPHILLLWSIMPVEGGYYPGLAVLPARTEVAVKHELPPCAKPFWTHVYRCLLPWSCLVACRLLPADLNPKTEETQRTVGGEGHLSRPDQSSYGSLYFRENPGAHTHMPYWCVILPLCPEEWDYYHTWGSASHQGLSPPAIETHSPSVSHCFHTISGVAT